MVSDTRGDCFWHPKGTNMNARPWLDSLGVFDLETTGTDVFSDRIVSAHVGLIDASGQPLEQKQWIVNPGIEIPQGAIDVHGISNERAQAEGQPAAEGVSEILERLRYLIQSKVVLVAFNASFDFSMLNAEAIRYGLEPLPARFPILDPFILDKVIDKWRKGSRKLVDTCTAYGFELENAHDASADAIGAGRLVQALFSSPKASALPESLRDVYDLQIRESAAQAASFQEYLRKSKDPDAVINGEWPLRALPVEVPTAA
jgi:DNA polymerase-3 subunit epsilon